MNETLYRFFIGAAIICFAIRLVTDIRYCAVVGAILLMIAGILKVHADYKCGKIGSKKHKKKVLGNNAQ